MKKAIILHGMPSKEEYFDPKAPSSSHWHWLPWIQRQLILKGILAQTPELPEPYEPVYEKWKEVFGQFKADEDTILVGHSCGGGFLVRWLSETDKKVGKVALVAPWLDPNGELASDFFKFAIDPDMAGKTAGITVFISPNDDREMQDSADFIKKTVKGARIITLPDKGHFIFAHMGTNEFPELLNELI